ncbi:hypothetical protein RQP46_010308 [Phenoliferia psychrophenolica]
MGALSSIFARSPLGYDSLPQADPGTASSAILSSKRLGLTSATGERLVLVLGSNGLKVEGDDQAPSKSRRAANRTPSGAVPYLYVLSASVTDGTLDLAAVHERGGAGKPLVLWRLTADVSAVDRDGLAGWVSELLERAYAGVKPHRRFLVLVNPHGGQGKALRIWKENIEPIFIAAGAHSLLQLTGPSGTPTNATTLAKDLDLDLYDALVPISGDGITSELLNGLASRSDALLALQTPIAPIPAGSGNAVSINLFGDRIDDPVYAALNAIKGKPIPLDICTVKQGERTTYSFLSQAFGLVADLDLGTEWMRWMGDTRFILGFLWGVLTRKTYMVDLSVKIVESDKAALVADYNAARAQINATPPSPTPSTPSPSNPTSPSATLVTAFPTSRFGTTTSPLPVGPVHTALSTALEPGWHTFHLPLQLLYAGRLPWVARDSMQFPLARDDGLIDLVLVGPRSIAASFKALEGLERGAALSLPETFYYKVEAYRCVPAASKGYISIDGESIPHEAFQVENHPRLARVMSLSGRFHGLERVDL